MSEKVSVARLRLRRALRIGRLFGLFQSIMILLLLVWMSVEYDHNQFFQAWAGARLGGLSFFLNGTLAAFYAGVVIAYYLSLPADKKEIVDRKKEEVLAAAEARV